MTSKEKTRYEELEAKDCLVDEDEIIEYYELKCKMLEEENKELLIALENKNNEIKFLKTLINDNKPKKAIEIFKDKVGFIFHIDNGNKYYFSSEYLFNEITKEEYVLLKEVLGNDK